MQVEVEIAGKVFKLNEGNAFYDWLVKHYDARKDRVVQLFTKEIEQITSDLLKGVWTFSEIVDDCLRSLLIQPGRKYVKIHV